MLTYAKIATISSKQTLAALCIVTETSGSTPRKAGAKMVVYADGSELGQIEGTIGGGAVEHQVRKRAIETLTTLRPIQFKLALTSELGMCCGGQMTVFIEPLGAKTPFILFGAGHIALAIAKFANDSGFALHVCDPRKELLSAERLPFATKLHSGYGTSELSEMPFGSGAFVLIVTHCHQTDQELTEAVLEKPFRYLGLVGSKRKSAMARQRCLNKGYSQELVDRINCPAGLDIHAETPEEIAISILAQMIQVLRAS